MSRGWIKKIILELDDLQDYINEIENESNRNAMEFVVGSIRDYLDEIETELDDINRCIGRIV